jgi:hypothetical protein
MTPCFGFGRGMALPVRKGMLESQILQIKNHQPNKTNHEHDT